jgi:hypothetical protein
MIAKYDILKDLHALDLLYNKARGKKKPLFYSKLAVIELCGWIEMTMDNIVLSCAKRHVKETKNFEWVKDELVGTVYGFTYKGHFRKMLRGFIGITCLEMLEAKLDTVKFTRMESHLGALKDARNPVAHTHLRGVTARLDAPSVTRNRFSHIYDGLVDIDSKLNAFKPKGVI